MQINSDLLGTIPKDIEKLKSSIKLLWKNPRPNSTFNAQTITLNSSNYTHYMVIFSTSTSGAVLCNTGLIPKAIKCELSTTYAESNQWHIRYRGLNGATATTLNFKDAITDSKGGTQSINNTFNIPLYVIGFNLGI